MPADRRGIENNLGTAQSGQPRRLGIPLIPANTDTDFALARIPRLKSKIARREVKFLVVKRIVRDVHLSILAKEFSVRVDDGGAIMINAGAALLKQRCNDDDAELFREFFESRCRFSGNFFGQREVGVIFALAEILRSEKLR